MLLLLGPSSSPSSSSFFPSPSFLLYPSTVFFVFLFFFCIARIRGTNEKKLAISRKIWIGTIYRTYTLLLYIPVLRPRACAMCKVRRIDKKGAYLISELSHPSSPGWHNFRFKRYLIRNGGVTGFFSDCRSRFNVYGKNSSFFSSWI